MAITPSSPGGPREPPHAGGPPGAAPSGSPPPLLPKVSLPVGGGAIRGIDEKFSTNPASGTASLVVPLPVSPAREGFELPLQLQYDSGAGNTPFGLGWQLSTTEISRRTANGLPRYRDDGAEADVFVLSGADDLVPGPVLNNVGGADFVVRQYRPRSEGTFARIERWQHRQTHAIHWRVTSRDNILNIYGRTRSAQIADPERPERVFSWLLEEMRDGRGNVARYLYKGEDEVGIQFDTANESNRFTTRPNGTRALRPTAQRYLKRILYGNRAPVADRTAPAPAADDDYLFHIVFDYGEHDALSPTPRGDEAINAPRWPVRFDPFSQYRAGFEVRTYRLCRRVLLFHRFDELGVTPCLVRSTDFVHDEQPFATYLTGITQSRYQRDPGTGAYTRASMPRLDLGYVQPIIRDAVRSLDPAALEGVPAGITPPDAQWADLDGEGLPGVLVPTTGAWFYKRNQGEGRFAPPALVATTPVAADLRGGAQQLVDLDGDGGLELVTHTPPVAGYHERSADGRWGPFAPFASASTLDMTDGNVRVADVDGDGLADLLSLTCDAIVWQKSRGKRGFDPASSVAKPRDERDGAVVMFTDGTETIQLADMSGDGLVDIVRIRSGEVSYWPNLGHGCFGRRVTFANSPTFDAPDAFDPSRIRIGDIDGSGTSDLVYWGSDGVRIFLNHSGNSFSDPVALATPAVDSGSSLDVVDLLGQGTACLVWSSSLPDARKPVRYIDLMGGRKPHLLESIVNNLGAETRVTYAPSTQFYLRDAAAGRPWLTRLAFPVHVIERVERQDRVTGSRLVTRFSYHHGHFDGYEREFRGFARVEQWDAETFSGEDLNLPPVRTVTWFHTGAWLERERLERALAREYYSGDPLTRLLPDTRLPPAASARAERDMARALRGQVLRQEVYADDDTAASAHPYTASERAYGVRIVQAPDATANGVYFVHPQESIDYHYERQAANPRVRHELVLGVDDFGNVTATVSLAYPHRAPAESEQARLWATLQERTFANRAAEPDWYRVGVPIEIRTSELTGLPQPQGGYFDVDAMRGHVAAAADLQYEDAPDGSLQRRTVDRERRLYYRDYANLAEYRADAAGSLPLGEISAQALPHHIMRQVFTAGLVTSVYGPRVADADLRGECGYVQEGAGWWMSLGRGVFDPARFYLAVEAIDAFGKWTAVDYDAYSLLVVAARAPRLSEEAGSGQVDAVDPARFGSVTTVANDYRVLAPVAIADTNGCRTLVEFDTMAMVSKIWRRGPLGSMEGDPDGQPGIEFRYDLDAWRAGRGPVFAHAAVRETHGAGGDAFDGAGQPTRLGFQHARTYSDGFSREVMKKIQAEGGPVPELGPDGRLIRNPDGTPRMRQSAVRWVGSGRTVFDNKGNPVKQYEPFFSASIGFEQEPELVEWGVTSVLRYDPLARIVRTDRPNGTHTRVVIDAWSQVQWDENDTVAGTPWLAAKQAGSAAEQRCAALALAHAGTPTRTLLDALGRAFLRIADNGAAGTRAERVAFDVEGNQLSVTDGRNNVVLRQIFDMASRPVRIVRSESGPLNGTGDRRAVPVSADPDGARTLFDAGNRIRRTWDERGIVLRHIYDELGRLTHRYASDGQNAEVLAERVVYGEAHDDAQARKLRSHPHLSFDSAGVMESARFDLAGNALETSRRVLRDFRSIPDWITLDGAAGLPAIVAAADALLEVESFTTTSTFDAMDRLTSRTTPDASLTTYVYNDAGFVETISVGVRGAAARAFVVSAEYNARGQRETMVCGNNTTITCRYDPFTFRLTGQRTVRTTDGATLQDLAYEHDPVGNIVASTDGVSFGNNAVPASGAYEYDALYQLVRAEGREHPGLQREDDDAPLLALDHPNDLQALRRYRQSYSYDAAGNIERIVHQPIGGGAGWSRSYAYAPDSDRLLRTSMPGDPAGTLSGVYQSDNRGCMRRMPHLAGIEWDYAERLRHVSRQAQNPPGPADDVYCAYDASGGRVRKTYEHGALIDERIYVEGFEVYRRRPAAGGQPTLERQTLHVEETRRIALIETRTIDAAVPAFAPVTRHRFQIDNQVGSSLMELDQAGGVITCEEYYPFGATSMIAGDSAADVSAKRYRYVGRERDDETGLSYHGARYYAAWLGRWISPDPAGLVDGPNVFAYSRNNPIRLYDDNGRAAGDADKKAPKQQSHVVILGEEIPGRKGVTGNADKWVQKLLNSSTVERFSERVKPGDRVLIALSPNVTDRERKEIQKSVDTFRGGYGDNPPTVDVKTVAPDKLAGEVNALDNKATLIFFGHGSDVPKYGDWESFPKPTDFEAGKFASDATALWASCNLDTYAEAFTKQTGVTSLGVEGTTWFGIETISAGILDDGDPGTSKLWRFDLVPTKDGKGTEVVKSGPFSINSWGLPILQPVEPRDRNDPARRDPFMPEWPEIYMLHPKVAPKPQKQKKQERPAVVPAR